MSGLHPMFWLRLHITELYLGKQQIKKTCVFELLFNFTYIDFLIDLQYTITQVHKETCL